MIYVIPNLSILSRSAGLPDATHQNVTGLVIGTRQAILGSGRSQGVWIASLFCLQGKGRRLDLTP